MASLGTSNIRNEPCAEECIKGQMNGSISVRKTKEEKLKEEKLKEEKLKEEKLKEEKMESSRESLPSLSSVPLSKCSSIDSQEIEKQMEFLFAEVAKKDGFLPEFMQAFHEVLFNLKPLFIKHPKYLNVLRIIAEPEKLFVFRVPWLDDNGIQRVNRGYRVQYSSALGPYKGGIRFHPSVNMSVIKFLGFEQIFKNSLTSLQLGGGKGGADFDPKGKSDAEVQRFCQSFMTALYKHIGWNIDIPAGDIGVGNREIGYLYGQYKRLTNNFEGVLTGKNIKWGGSHLRPEATGYGCVYMAQEIARYMKNPLQNMSCIISGSGNVALYCAEKCIQMGLKVLTLSDSYGYIYEADGLTAKQLEDIMHLRTHKRAKLCEYLNHSETAIYREGEKVWRVTEDPEVLVDVAFPCATENEIDELDAQLLHKRKCKIIVEGANMPSTAKAIQFFKNNNMVFCPGKAANAGGVAVSGLEMSQNAMRIAWKRDKVDEELMKIMKTIFERISRTADTYVGDPLDLIAGANIEGFLKVADAVIEQGCV